MKATIANRQDSSFRFAKSTKDKAEFKRNVEFSKNSAEEVMSISKAEPVQNTGSPNLEEKINTPFKDATRRRPTLKEFQERKYPFADSNLS